MEREKRNALRRSAVLALGNRCAACGDEDYDCLDIDHIFDDGSDERHINAKIRMWKAIVANPASAALRYQLLCAKHNALKQRNPAEFNARYGSLIKK